MPQAPDGPPRRFCSGGAGPSACETAAAQQRAAGIGAPGLTGKVALAWDLVERLEDAAGQLATALDGELTVAGVEARIAQVRAETAAVEAEAHRATETARSQAREALAAADAQHRRADDAEAMSAELRGRLDELSADHERLRGDLEQRVRRAEETDTALAAARRDRAQLADQVTELTGSLQSALEEAKRLRAALVTAQAAEKAVRGQAATMAAELRQQRLRLEEVAAERADALQDASRARAETHAEHTARIKAEQQARDARDQVGDALIQRDRALETTGSAHERLDQTRTALAEQQAEAARQARLAGELQAKVNMLIAERDAARAEAERARRSIDQFIADQRRGADGDGVQQLRAIGPQTASRSEGSGTRQPDGTVSILHPRPATGTASAPAAASGDH